MSLVYPKSVSLSIGVEACVFVSIGKERLAIAMSLVELVVRAVVFEDLRKDNVINFFK